MEIKENKYFIFDRRRKITLLFCIKQLLAMIYCFSIGVIFKILPKPARKSKKYKVSICAIFKNEGDYLKEWIEYHLLIGVDHFYMYDNNSNDNCMEVLSPYINSGIVTLIKWEKNQAQLEAYRDCVSKFREESKWIGFIDLDEFVVPISKDNIYDFLKQFNEKAGSVLIYWKVFGSSGRVNRNMEGFVTEDFTVSWNKLCDIGKCFFNTDFLIDFNYKRNTTFHHFLWTKYRGLYLPPKNMFGHFCVATCHHMNAKAIPIQINHYLNKSIEEYKKKISKGDVFFKENPHSLDYFFGPEKYCTSTDYNIYKYITRLKLKIINNTEEIENKSSI